MVGNDSYWHPFCRFLRQNAGHHHRRLRFLQRSRHPLHHDDGRHVLLDRTHGNRRKIRHPENGNRPPFPSDPFPLSRTADTLNNDVLEKLQGADEFLDLLNKFKEADTDKDGYISVQEYIEMKVSEYEERIEEFQ